MHDTLKVRTRGHLLPSSSHRPASAITTGFPRPGCPGDPVWHRRLAVNHFLARALREATCRPHPGRACPAVAYSSGIQSRLGYSPNGVFDAAYHTTTGKSRSKTNNSLDKKNRGFLAAPSASPGAAESRKRSWTHTLARGGRDGFQASYAHHVPIIW